MRYPIQWLFISVALVGLLLSILGTKTYAPKAVLYRVGARDFVLIEWRTSSRFGRHRVDYMVVSLQEENCVSASVKQFTNGGVELPTTNYDRIQDFGSGLICVVYPSNVDPASLDRDILNACEHRTGFQAFVGEVLSAKQALATGSE